MEYRYDALVPLGGGRTDDGNLTDLSIQRLEKAFKLYVEKLAPEVITVGPKHNFPESGAMVRKRFLISKGIPEAKIIPVEEGGDTVLEAFACRKIVESKIFSRILVITSKEHTSRALTIFRRVLKNDIRLEIDGVSCQGILNVREEKEYEQWFLKYFSTYPDYISYPSLETWYKDMDKYYSGYRRIFEKYHQAYSASLWRNHN
jgi:uncharacterized SAM-binding protein YcdF (DUF218 family)